MPIFIDRHDSPGASPEEVAADHLKDLAVQEQYGVRYFTYWFDADSRAVFCVAEGPSREAVKPHTFASTEEVQSQFWRSGNDH